MRTLVIVESPSKAKTIGGYLGNQFEVLSCYGHFRDLPRDVHDLEPWQQGLPHAKLGVNIDAGFELMYVYPRARPGDKGMDARTLVAKLRAAAANADRVLIATDGDREGEAIAWALAQALELGDDALRIAFNEITPDAIRAAVANPGRIDMNLVSAQEARRALDRLIGYFISPEVIRAIGPGASAGRVQSVALGGLVRQEVARLSHVSGGYVRLTATVSTTEGQSFVAALVQRAGVRLATPKDFLPDGTLKPEIEALVIGEAEARALAQRIKNTPLTVMGGEEHPFVTRPPVPFITSTLQRQASQLLKMSPKKTMETAQALYDNGFVTYMRTDSPNLSDQATTGARAAATALFGPAACPAEARAYKAKSDLAQEGHEAIRPSGATFRTPQETGLEGEQLALYDMIFRRTVASQMTDLHGVRTTVFLTWEDLVFSAQGRSVTTPGFTQMYEEVKTLKDDAPAPQHVPLLTAGETFKALDTDVEARKTPAPSRYTEASLVEALETAEVGRPSTYVAVLETLVNRNYMAVDEKAKRQLSVSWLGLLVNHYLQENFPRFVSAQFTAAMEADLDRIASGQLGYRDYMTHFFTAELSPALNAASSTPPSFPLPLTQGVHVQWREGAPVLVQGKRTGPVPEYLWPEDVTADIADRILDGEVIPKKRARKPGASKKAESGA